jgi:hypothetical protein
MKFALFLTVILFITGCTEEKIETGSTLDKKVILLIESLGLLEDGEEIIQFYSNFEKEKAGSFFTDKRVAHYWLDDFYADKSDTTFAYYGDIASIDTVYRVPDTFSPYMEIKRLDGSRFRAYVDGNREQIKSFFEETIRRWKQKKRNKLAINRFNEVSFPYRFRDKLHWHEKNNLSHNNRFLFL